ncbi:hypothetical protein ATB53_16060 [Xanthomonas translucens]|uniref:Uncharacterized protein n=1 Tax=Xanthomonas campestris pv. translucens TaxID=343 RepID=A0A109HGQ5_XANCT|nr:hypothetical protein ATB54_04500 [Xanthomonas translucens]KWV13242.1 hypothetical protein ATB53_16060 [Xanthomonas translucens]OAX66219.1 hypothetical protein A6R79_00065 [Xanthomonas translucens pv. translucens]
MVNLFLKVANHLLQFVAAFDLLPPLIDEHPSAALLQLVLQVQRCCVLWKIFIFEILALFDKIVDFWQQVRLDPATYGAFCRGQITF